MIGASEAVVTGSKQCRSGSEDKRHSQEPAFDKLVAELDRRHHQFQQFLRIRHTQIESFRECLKTYDFALGCKDRWIDRQAGNIFNQRHRQCHDN